MAPGQGPYQRFRAAHFRPLFQASQEPEYAAMDRIAQPFQFFRCFGR